MELQYSQQAIECAPLGSKEGRIIGSGNGTVKGKVVNGIIQWSNYESTVNVGLCKLQIPGVIVTKEGEKILFEAPGMAKALITDKSEQWAVARVFYFNTSSKIYNWLNGILALYDGEFNMKSASAVYTAYFKSNVH